MKRYYYIDDNNNKIYYAGKIISDKLTNKCYGILTVEENKSTRVNLTYNGGIPAIEGYQSYFTYMYNGKEYRYDNNNYIKKIGNNYYIDKFKTNEIELNYHEETKEVPEYFTYIGKFGKECIYNGEILFDDKKNTYYFYK